MRTVPLHCRPTATSAGALRPSPICCAALLAAAGCVSASAPPSTSTPAIRSEAAPPSPDPRVALRGGLFDAEQAVWNLRLVSSTPPPAEFIGHWSSDLAFTGDYAIQGNFQGFQIWDISDPRRPERVTVHVCPGAQNDVSVHGNLLFLSVEDPVARLDCGTQGVAEAVSAERMGGVRIFDLSDIRNPRLVANVQTCRGSHTHTVLVDPQDPDNVYIYNSGVAPVRPAQELPGCSGAPPADDPASALSRIEIIRVPLADPERAAIASTPGILQGLVAAPRHGMMAEDRAVVEAAKARGAFVATVLGEEMVVPDEFVTPALAAIVEARGGAGAPAAADSAAFRAQILTMMAAFGGDEPTMCHDLTMYPAIGLAGGACLGYGLLLDTRDPLQPKRLHAVADSNFVAWHSATFSNDGTKLLFTDEWGGGTLPKCRASDPREWGANAIYTIEDGQLAFRSYYKMPAAQSTEENCVAHNGSLVPVPGRDVMVQSWLQGGISVFDWTDPANPFEIAFHDRGPVDADQLVFAGSWSAYWYNGYVYSSESLRGLDIFELLPSAFLSQNEIDAANTVRLDDLNVQGQPRFVWPSTFTLARAYADQLERSDGLAAARIASVRRALADAERASGSARRQALERLATQLDADAAGSGDRRKIGMLAGVVRELASAESHRD